MSWIQLSLEAGDLDPEALSSFFEEQGALSVTFVDAADQPLYEPEPGTTPLWSSTRITALYDQDVNLALLRERLALAFGQEAAGRLRGETLEDQAWERAWLDQGHRVRGDATGRRACGRRRHSRVVARWRQIARHSHSST